MFHKSKFAGETDSRHPRERMVFLYLPLLAALVTLIIELFNHKAFTTGFSAFLKFAAEGPLALLVDVLIVLVTLAPAVFLRRRAFYCTLVSAVWLIGGAVNGFILLNRMTPFNVADMTVFTTGIDTLPNYLSTRYIVLLAGALVILLASLVLLFWKGPRNAVPGRRRAFASMLSMLVACGLLGGSWALAFHTKQLSNVFSNLAFAYEDYGFSYCFLQTWLNRGIHQPSGYSAAAVKQVEQNVEENSADTGTPQTDVNVIYVQLESFIDPDEIRGLELSGEAAPTWNALTGEYSSGYLTVPVVGAGTANTECEVLTGMSTRFFGPGEYPYQTQLDEKTVESVAYDLKENGYGTHAIHNHRATFYGRNVVYANLGFDDFTSLEYMPKTDVTPQNWAKDGILTSQIVKALDATPDQPDLVFTVSVQGHGKYPTEQVLEHPDITVEACPDEEYHYAVEYYVNQIHEMDRFLASLTAALNRRAEKTALVLYGDHLPSLGLEPKDMESGTLYQTEYVIWDNFGLEQQDENLAAYQLSSMVLERLGITTGFMNRFHQTCREQTGYRADLKLLQYDVLYGQQYLYRDQPSYEPTDMQMGVAPITMNNISKVNDVWYIAGENFSPYCRVTTGDGELLKTTYLSPWLLEVTEDPGTADVEDLFISVVDKHHEILSDTE